MKLIVIDIDKLKVSTAYKKYINAYKICTLNKRDFGKKTLLGVKRHHPDILRASKEWRDAIFKIKEDDNELKYEDKLFRKIFKHIKYVRIGVIIRREKAVKILLKLLGR